MRHVLLTAFFLFVAVVPEEASAQYKFDIKTELAEKADLKVVKKGVITAVDQSTWATEVEFNERYSLWLKDSFRKHRQDSVYVGMNVELRTPAALTSGDLMAERNVWIRYHWEQAQEYARDSIDASMLTSDDRASMMKFLGLTGKVMDAAEDVSTGGLTAPGDEGMYVDLLRGIVRGMQYEPSPVKVMEALALGNQTVEVTEAMVKNAER